MPSVCCYFQMHQPMRLRRYSVFDTNPDYFDAELNRSVLDKVAGKCYIPATKAISDLVKKHDGEFRVSFGVTGVLLTQLRAHAPEVIDQLASLAETGHVDFAAEPYYHSLSFMYSRDEFREQVEMQAETLEELFGVKPVVFRNTEMIYNNDLAHFIAGLGKYNGILTEGADRILEDRSPNVSYSPPHTDGVTLLLRNYRLSDDIAFRFSNQDWSEHPLTAEKFAGWIKQIDSEGDNRLCNLFMDFETFGEHQWEQTGIFGFLEQLPRAVLDAGSRFVTLREGVEAHPPADQLDVSNMISWADTERDLSAWIGNAMQSNAMHELYKLEDGVKSRGDKQLLEDWRLLTVSDHFYYMCTKYFADAAVHDYFNPYESPYDSYINFMNVLDNLRSRVGE